MKSSFQTKLFRLLLLFSVIPALVLTVVGFYLMSEITLSHSDADTGISAVSEYYNEFLFDRTNRQLGAYLQSGSAANTDLDFLFESVNGQITDIDGTPLVNPDIARRIIVAASDRARGFVEYQNQVFQYVCRDVGPGHRAYAGVLHNRSFTSMLEQVRDDTAARNLTRRLQSEYLFFAALVLAVLTLLTMGSAYLFSSRLSRNLARPLHQLSEASQKIAEGDFQQEVTPSGEAETRALMENFNRMTRQLDQTATKLAQTERVAAWRQVARRFAHELKNPLQPLLVSLYRIEQLLKDTESYSNVYEPLKAAAEEVRHLKNLADRFSHLAKLPPPSLEDTDLKALLRSIADLYREQLAGRRFELVLPEADVHGAVDRAYLREALHNLLQNAIDATTSGDQIWLGLEASESRIRITVSDSGVGMDQATIAQARLPYFTTKKKGTGLGLAVVERSVDEMGGQLLVSSLSGEGSTVELVLRKE
jgi:nitrogen fixation/metabolism regulation signal transduction histidine kinase